MNQPQTCQCCHGTHCDLHDGPPPEVANTTVDLKEILRRITFAKSCMDFEWNWDVEELVKCTPVGIVGSVIVPESAQCPSVKVSIPDLAGWHINTTFRRPDINTGQIGTGKGRKLYIEKGTSSTGVFFTCFVLAELIIKHELMEAIRYNGKHVLNPHHTLAELSMPDAVRELTKVIVDEWNTQHSNEKK